MRNLLKIIESEMNKFKKSKLVEFNFDIFISRHAQLRQKGIGREIMSDYDLTPISDDLILDTINNSLEIVVQNILEGNIENITNFIVTSIDNNLSMAIVASQRQPTLTNWKLTIKTVFRATESLSIRKNKNQLEILI